MMRTPIILHFLRHAWERNISIRTDFAFLLKRKSHHYLYFLLIPPHRTDSGRIPTEADTCTQHPATSACNKRFGFSFRGKARLWCSVFGLAWLPWKRRQKLTKRIQRRSHRKKGKDHHQDDPDTRIDWINFSFSCVPQQVLVCYLPDCS